jgi:hypothetical protein
MKPSIVRGRVAVLCPKRSWLPGIAMEKMSPEVIDEALRRISLAEEAISLGEDKV